VTGGVVGLSRWQVTGTSKARRPLNMKRSWALNVTLVPAAGRGLGYVVGLQVTDTLTALVPGGTCAFAAGLVTVSMMKAAAWGPTGTTSSSSREAVPLLSRVMVLAAVATLRLVWPKSAQELAAPSAGVAHGAAGRHAEEQGRLRCQRVGDKA
jgi:hypothetical protein